MSEHDDLIEDDEHDGCPCRDCGALTAPLDGPAEWYTLKDEVWPLAPDDGYLCIGCLERRIGRTVVYRDFDTAPINAPGWGWKTDRLMARLMSHHASEVAAIETMLGEVSS